MKLDAYGEALAALTNNASSIPIRVEWEEYSADGKFMSRDSDNNSTVNNASYATIAAYSGVDDGRTRLITRIMFLNTDVVNTTTIRFAVLLKDFGDSPRPCTPLFSVAPLGMVEYSPLYGWKLYKAGGSLFETGPTGPQGDVGPAGANGTATTVEAHLGYTPQWTGTFTITDASITSTSKLRVWQANGPYTGKGTRADEAEMEIVDCIAYPATGSATVRWRSRDAISFARTMPQGGNSRTGLAVGTTTSTPPQDAVGLRTAVKRGAVWKNMKFTYQILG